MAGAVFGEVGVSLFAASVFSIQNASPRWDEEGLRGGGCEMTILCSDYVRIILGLSSDGRRIVFILAEAIQGFSAELLNSEFHGRRSIW